MRDWFDQITDCWCGHGSGDHYVERGEGMYGDAVICEACGWTCNNSHPQRHDDHCTVDPATHCCKTCGVEHGEPCELCGGAGFHVPTCETLEGNR